MNEENKNQTLENEPQGDPKPNEPTQEPKPQDAPKTFTEAELDRRIQQAVATNTKNVKEKLEKYYEEKAMQDNQKTAEERVNEIIAKHEAEMKERERQANIREAEVELKKAGFDKTDIDFFTSENVTNDKDESMAKIMRICKIRQENQEKLKKSFNEQMAQQFGQGINSGKGGEEISYDKFKEMGLLERVELKNKNPEMYKKLIEKEKKE